MNTPTVSVITPTTYRSMEMLERCIYMFLYQDYEGDMNMVIGAETVHFTSSDQRIQLIQTPSQLGAKRNYCAQASRSDIILHMDDDDLYSHDWVSVSVNALISSCADVVGLNNAYFYNAQRKVCHEYIPPQSSQLHLLGATLCYWRKTWERKPFADHLTEGEDTNFITNAGILFAHGHKKGFTAIVHGNNTASHKALPMMPKISYVPELVQQFHPQRG